MKRLLQISVVMVVSLVFLSGCGTTHYFKGSATTPELEKRVALLEKMSKTLDKVENKDSPAKKAVKGKILTAAGKIAEEIGNVGDEREGVSYDNNWAGSGDLAVVAAADDRFNQNFKTVGFKSVNLLKTANFTVNRPAQEFINSNTGVLINDWHQASRLVVKNSQGKVIINQVVPAKTAVQAFLPDGQYQGEWSLDKGNLITIFVRQDKKVQTGRYQAGWFFKLSGG